MTTLSINGLIVNRSGIPVVRGVEIEAKSGEISVLLGSNGAGKTTLLEGISGIIASAAGEVMLDGHDLMRARAGVRARAGLSHVEQGRTVFSQMTTEENLKVALHPDATLDEAYALFPELRQRRDIAAGMLSGGEQQMVVIARALVGRPKVIMIDEMSSGLAPVVVSRLMTAVRKLADDGMAVILVEQFATLALAIGNRAYVLRRGQTVYDGGCEELARDPARLHRLYLGEASEAT
ncbi:ABC transporter ATP-binding protein [Rhizobium sp. KVB221]|uniref:ABC transporter ATP-binding protein n=1 Tax=Rhizobium setariae TaxID=2801340 RepID=A0A936YS43_9HYPH|nr:ABC transporter ATP-binding protein [Rhizobium setariae]MBL0373234.1 ABC transporter ATP-binding protein [Rhizobium setariae]